MEIMPLAVRVKGVKGFGLKVTGDYFSSFITLAPGEGRQGKPATLHSSCPSYLHLTGIPGEGFSDGCGGYFEVNNEAF